MRDTFLSFGVGIRYLNIYLRQILQVKILYFVNNSLVSN